MKKVGILLENLFDERELIYPYYKLKEEFEVELIGSERDTLYTGKSGGFEVKSDISSKEAKVDDYIGLYIPGGYSPDYMRGCKDTLNFVSSFYESGKIIASICHGPWVLADAIDLKGIKMTSVPKIRKDFIHAGADWVDQALVFDKNILTSRTPDDISKQLVKFIELLKE